MIYDVLMGPAKKIKMDEVDTVSSVSEFFISVLMGISEYGGLEMILGAANTRPTTQETPYVSMSDKWGMQGRGSLLFGFSDYHAWDWTFEFALISPDAYEISLLSTHRFSQKTGFFMDFVWGYGGYSDQSLPEEVEKSGWILGLDVGFNIFHTRNHWLSLAFGYEHLFNGVDSRTLSLNLVYTFRGYYDDE